jgi:hypothetical protein
MSRFGLKNMESAMEQEGAQNAEQNAAEQNAEQNNASEQNAENQEQQQEQQQSQEQNAQNNEEVALTPEQVRAYFKANGREVENIDDLFVEKVKEVNPYETISPELKAILDYNKETGRGLSDYQQLQRDIDKIPALDLALAKVKEDVGEDLSNEDAISYLEDSLGVDLSDDELSPLDKIKLTKFVKEYKEGLKAIQEKYKTPLQTEENAASKVEMVTLADGQKIEKTVFDAHQKQRQAYIEEMKVAVDSVAKTSLSIEFDNNGVKENYTFDYEHDQADKKNMLALTEDIDKTAAALFRTEKGFNHQGFAKAVWRLDPKNWEKEVSAIVNKAIAENTERITQNENNVNFNRNRIPSGNGAQQKDIFTGQSGFGVKFNM